LKKAQPRERVSNFRLSALSFAKPPPNFKALQPTIDLCNDKEHQKYVTRLLVHLVIHAANKMTVSENFVPPSQQRNLRACMVCSIVMTQNVRLPFLLSPPFYHCHSYLPLTEIHERRLSQLRRIPPSPRQLRRDRRLHIASLRRAHRAGRSVQELGCEVAAVRWVCGRCLCDEG
jgi:hypothetical protein